DGAALATLRHRARMIVASRGRGQPCRRDARGGGHLRWAPRRGRCWRSRMTRFAVAVALVGLACSGARAVTQADIDAAAPFASRGIGSTVRFLASDRLKGGDNDTPEA